VDHIAHGVLVGLDELGDHRHAVTAGEASSIIARR
jgi:hypothetical protein